MKSYTTPDGFGWEIVLYQNQLRYNLPAAQTTKASLLVYIAKRISELEKLRSELEADE